MENVQLQGTVLDENRCETNKAVLQGVVLTELKFSHKSYGESFYLFEVGIGRKSGYRDEIKIVISERLIWDIAINAGARVKIEGQIRTYNEENEGKSRLNIVVFARGVTLVGEQDSEPDENYIYLDGFLCKPPIRRTSPLGRELCDIMLAVNRMYNKSDYIPCIAWGRNATYAGGLEVGTKLSIIGRIQSREYKKRDAEGNILNRIAYEVSILKIEE
ncbi:single-stranded DNA-binding protein [Aminipila luticellarii]|uniref:Single-stranded DNA-binding protein n=1 Tax=Aminipila luticellarii TaxID=2507160 RepID=A0A410PU66_9FIRM|nr:single-stranded DNA-binding protein [Aminipila luticellarii]QAT42416.1 single-stranded DNA-binding protein [Aminipila luticellarii]